VTTSSPDPLPGILRISDDEMMAHLALILGGVGTGETRIRGLRASNALRQTANAMTAMGAVISGTGDDWVILGAGNGALLQAEQPLEFEGSPLGAMLTIGLVATYDMETGFAGTSAEALQPALDPLRQMGMQVHDQSPVLTISGAKRSSPISYRLPAKSRETKAGVMLAALNAPGITTVIEPAPIEDEIAKILSAFGAVIEVETDADGARHVRIHGEPKLVGLVIEILKTDSD
jgi:3-phosphoshikimate 1-carboxyvinyltransferase